MDQNALFAALSALDGTVLVVGDVMLDVFAYGQTNRISPEAPIPVMRLQREVQMLGGAGNVARNIAALGGRVILLGVVGADACGAAVEALVAEESGVDGRLLHLSGRQTTVKRRFVVGGQQMLRVDQEDTAVLDEAEERELAARVEAALSAVSAVVLSDYGKGVLSPRVIRAAIDTARNAGVPLLVDPKHPEVSRYDGATAVTPNAHELAAFTGGTLDDDAAVEAAARRMIADTRAAFLIVTRSEQGLSYVPTDGTTLHMPAHKREVFDVAGAGDTLVGTLALALGGGVAPPIAAALANVAAGIVVGKAGTATCSLTELELELFETGLRLGAKLQSVGHIGRLADQWRRSGLRVGFTNGCFDLLHPGHVSLLAAARGRCDRLVLGLNSDNSVRRLKGETRPLQTQASRATVLAALTSVDVIVIFDDDTPMDLIGQVRPSVLFKGADYTVDTVVGADLVRSYGGTVELIGLVEGHSTTGIVRRMR